MSQETNGERVPPKWWNKLVKKRKAQNTRNTGSKIQEKGKEAESRNRRNESLKNPNHKLTKIVPKFPAQIPISLVGQETRSWEFTFNCPKTSCTLGFWWKQRQIVSERKRLLPRPHWISTNNFSKTVNGLRWGQPTAQGSLALWVRTSGNTQTNRHGDSRCQWTWPHQKTDVFTILKEEK